MAKTFDEKGTEAVFREEAKRACAALRAARTLAGAMMSNVDWPLLTPYEHLAISRCVEALEAAAKRPFNVPETRRASRRSRKKDSG